jgi:hypothetical protein
MVARSRSSNKDSWKLPASARLRIAGARSVVIQVEPGGLENLFDPCLGDHAAITDRYRADHRSDHEVHEGRRMEVNPLNVRDAGEMAVVSGGAGCAGGPASAGGSGIALSMLATS